MQEEGLPPPCVKFALEAPAGIERETDMMRGWRANSLLGECTFALFHAIRKGKLVDACQFGCQISNCNLQWFSVKRKLATGRARGHILTLVVIFSIFARDDLEKCHHWLHSRLVNQLFIFLQIFLQKKVPSPDGCWYFLRVENNSVHSPSLPYTGTSVTSTGRKFR